MKILPVSPISYSGNKSSKNDLSTNPMQENSSNIKSIYDKGMLGNIYGAKVNKSSLSFKGYHGDSNPAKKLFWILTGRTSVYEDHWTKQHLFHGAGSSHDKKWVVAHPAELLRRGVDQAIQSIATLTKGDGYPKITNAVYSPNYGDNWGRHATYIEINPRTLGTKNGDKSREGLLGAIKMLPAIPPSGKSNPNCVVLSELYPTIHGDGYNGYSSLYTTNLHTGISKDLVSDGLWRDGQKMGDDELVKAFNDLAHIRGLKTGIRMPLSAGQMQVKGEGFNWNRHEKAYVDACAWAVDLGFDSIYFDSAKHVGGYDMGNYMGVGNTPNFQQMQYMLHDIRQKTGRHDLAFIGEKADKNAGHFKTMGLTAGTDWGKADNFESVRYESRDQAWNRDYAAGPEVSNDNDHGNISYEQRLNRLKSCLFGYDNPSNKLPCYMQMHDLFPLNHSTNTHDLMEHNRSFSAYGDTTSHWNNLFDGSDAANWYRFEVNKEFAQAADR